MSKISCYGPIACRRGYVATEVLVATIVLALAAGLVTASTAGGILRARKTALSRTLGELQQACDAFRVVCGGMPVAALTGGACLVDFAALDHEGNKFVPSYLRHAPASAAHSYGLSAEAGPTVYFGITPQGRIFATQQPPDTPGGWADIRTPVFVAGSATAVPYASIGAPGDAPPGPPPGPVPPTPVPPEGDVAATVELVSSRSAANTGEGVQVTARALTADGRPMAGLPVAFEITGSVTGTRYMTQRTNDSGQATIDITTAEPEIVIVRASVP